MHGLKWAPVKLFLSEVTLQQARSCLYASTQLNPHYFEKKNFSKKYVVWNSAAFKAIHLHFYAKINGFSLVKKALRRPQNAPNCTIYFKIIGGGDAPWPPRLFWIHILYRLATRLHYSAWHQRIRAYILIRSHTLIYVRPVS